MPICVVHQLYILSTFIKHRWIHVRSGVKMSRVMGGLKIIITRVGKQNMKNKIPPKRSDSTFIVLFRPLSPYVTLATQMTAYNFIILYRHKIKKLYFICMAAEFRSCFSNAEIIILAFHHQFSTSFEKRWTFAHMHLDLP